MATDVERLVVSLEANIKKYERELARANGVTTKALNDVESSVSRSASKIEGTMGRLAAGIRTGIAGALAGISLGKVTELADSYTKVQNALKVTGLEGEGLRATYQSLFDAAQRQGVPLQGLAELYGRVSLSQKELKVSSAELVTFAEGVAVALKVAGQTSQGASGALLQLSQVLGSGKVEFEDYKELIDGAPTVLKATAAGLTEAGGSVSTLTQLVKDGKISSEAFFRAFEAGRPALDELAEKTAPSFAQGVQRIENALTDMIGEADRLAGASEAVAAAVDEIVKAVGRVPEVFATTVQEIKAIIGVYNQLSSAIRTAANSVGILKDAPLPTQEGDPEPLAFRVRPKEGPSTSAGGGGRPAVRPVSYKRYGVPGGDKDKKGGGGSGGGDKDNDFEKEIKAIEKRTRAFDSEREAVGKSAIEVAKAEGAFKLLEAAQKAGIPVTDTLRGKIDTLALAYANAKVALDKAEEKQRNFEAMSRQAGSVLSDGFKDAVLEGEKLTVVLDRLVKSLASKGIDSIFDTLFAKDGAGTNLLKGAGGGFGGLLAGITGRAAGGPVKPGTAYTVGESGRETFVPTQPGRIVPARRMGASRSVRMGDININAPGADAAAVAQLRGYVDTSLRESRRTIGQQLAGWKENN